MIIANVLNCNISLDLIYLKNFLLFINRIIKNMSSYVIDFQDIDKTKLDLVGGKGANLGELFSIQDIKVPEGFCVTTKAYKEIVRNNKELKSLLAELTYLRSDNRKSIGEISRKIRKVIEEITIPENIISEILPFIKNKSNAYAVRSSATAEDLPTASFAGQQESYLNITGTDAILSNIKKCWASLFTERAVIYRLRNGIDDNNISLSVVIQEMVFPDASGIMFTADPVSSNRTIVSIDAGFGLGDAIVSGIVNADLYKVCNGRIIDKKISTKHLAVYALKNGGTKEFEIEPEKQNTQALTEEQILQLEQIGRRIEKHFGSPQDIEWCLAKNNFYIVQSRPITTLFPIPEADDKENHVYVSVGHQQMMTDAMKPLGISFFLLTTPAPMRKAGGRLFVDVTKMLASPESRKRIIDTLGKSDPLIKDALITIVERDNFIKKSESTGNSIKDMPSSGITTQTENNPDIVLELIKSNQVSIEELKHTIKTKSGTDLFNFILEDIKELKKYLFDPGSLNLIMAAMDASSWLNDKMNEWLGENNTADIISQSVSNNITSEMGLELLHVADSIRPYPEIIDYLKKVEDDNFLDEIVKFKGGQEIKNVIYAYLKKYGMRCSGEIDITKTRWSEKPIKLIPMILNNIKNFEAGAGIRKFEKGRQEALNKEQELLNRLMQLPDGDQKAKETKRKIDVIRNFSGYREYPKYGMINRYFVYKQALLKEAEELVKSGVLYEKEDFYYLSFEELREVVRTNKTDHHLINKRKEEYTLYEKFIPPRVITSDGEIITGKYNKENLPAGALAGLAVSSGIVEGRARVILSIEDADLEDGDILVTSFTDPGWTPLFVSIKGLVTEVGGLMTHGAVIAREYRLPAVVGVENASRLIKDGQRIRVNGTEGYVEII
jgi:rifampicin phosphotransferase